MCLFPLVLIGLQYSDFVLYCMSQGLLDPKTLELVQNRRCLDEVLLTPSYLLRELNDSSSRLSHFLGLSLSNLLEHESSRKGSLALDESLIAYLTANSIEADVTQMHCRGDWNLTDDNIRNELDRNDQSHVSFYFALRWL